MNLYFILATVQADQVWQQYCSELTYRVSQYFASCCAELFGLLGKENAAQNVENLCATIMLYHCKFISDILYFNFGFVLFIFFPKQYFMKGFSTLGYSLK